jgi:hypothetical protein
MKRLILAVVVLLFSVVPSWAQHAHEQAQVIDGAKNPELIPDSTAYRMVLLHLSTPSNYTADEKRTRHLIWENCNWGQKILNQL